MKEVPDLGPNPLFLSALCVVLSYEQPLVVPQLVHLWQLPLGTMIDPHSGQVGASVRTKKLYMDGVLGLATVCAICKV